MKDIKMPNPGYGASAHYQGQDGVSYFSAQAQAGRLGARWNLSVWNEYIRPEDSVLDFGCGGGYLLSVLQCQTRVGVEINPAARVMAESLGIDVYETLEGVNDMRFSRVISSHALEHVPSPLIALKQMYSCVAEMGQLLLLLPLDDWRSSAHRNYYAGDVHRHLYAWTPQNLGNLLDEAGFKKINVNVVTDAMPPNFRLAEIVLKSNTLRSIAGPLFGYLLRRRQLFACATI